MIRKFLFHDPIGWSEKAVGSSFRFYFMVSMHIIIGLMLIYPISVSSIPKAMALTMFPLFYLYALKNVLKELNKVNQNNK
ncbi:MAG: hypothetical protein ACYS3N_10335 [Planctomycetota bacterium]